MDDAVFTHIEFLKHRSYDNEKVVVPPHNHYFYEMTYVLDGCLYTDMNNKHYECEPNSIILVPPNVAHAHNSNDRYEVIYMGFYYNGLFGPLNQRVFKDDDEKTILRLLRQMLEEYDNTEKYYENICGELQKIFILNMLRLQDNNRPSNNDAVLKYAVSYMQDHYYDDIDMQELAKSLGYSYHHFRHIFKENFNMPPKQFLLNQRMQYAMRLLRTTNKNISEISRNCGFSSATRFISSFKALFNISPTQYRNSDTINLDICIFSDDTADADLRPTAQ